MVETWRGTPVSRRFDSHQSYQIDVNFVILLLRWTHVRIPTRMHGYTLTRTHTPVCEWITQVCCGCDHVRYFGHACHLQCVEEKVLPDAWHAQYLFSGDALLLVLPHRVCQHHSNIRFQSVDQYDGRPKCDLVFARHLQGLCCLHSLWRWNLFAHCECNNLQPLRCWQVFKCGGRILWVGLQVV